jgi:hypothetical protein
MATPTPIFYAAKPRGRQYGKRLKLVAIMYHYKHGASTTPALVALCSKGTPHIPAPFRFYGCRAKVHEPYITPPILKQ